MTALHVVHNGKGWIAKTEGKAGNRTNCCYVASVIICFICCKLLKTKGYIHRKDGAIKKIIM